MSKNQTKLHYDIDGLMSKTPSLKPLKSNKNINLKFKNIGDYTIKEFIEDCFDFMMDGFEETNSYFFADRNLLLHVDCKDFVTFGLKNNLFWVVPLNNTNFVYVELTNEWLKDELLSFYVNEYLRTTELSNLRKDEEFDKVFSELKTTYVKNLVRCMSELHKFISDDNENKTIGVASLLDVDYTGLEGNLVPVYKLSLSQFMLLLHSSKLKLVDSHSKLSPYSLFKNSKGYLKEGLDNIKVDATGSALFLEGVKVS